MRIVLVILLLSLIIKDAGQINDPYIFRGIGQGLALLLALIWLVTGMRAAYIKRYWPLFGYLAVSIVSGVFSPRMNYALIQSASLFAVIMFAIAYYESQKGTGKDPANLYFFTVITAYTLICIISIVLIKLNPPVVYSRVGNWLDLRAGMRFSGLFPVSGMMGAASGLLIGFTMFRKGKWYWRTIALGSGLVCLALTQSRTFWVATFATSIIVWWIYKPRARKIQAAVIFLAGVAVVTSMAFNLKLDTASLEKAVRWDSISSLTGRIPLWERSRDAFYNRPIVGYGSAVGSYALTDDGDRPIGMKNEREARSIGHETLHNGYVQSVLDLGMLGLFFYVAIFFVAIRRVYRYDIDRTGGAVLYGVLFMAIGNLGESIVYSASVSHSIVFWCVVVLAFHRFRPRYTSPGPSERVSVRVENSITSRVDAGSITRSSGRRML